MSVSRSPVTVIVPCLNAEATLAEALDSVLRQTAPPLEVLVIDDGSTDRSVDIARAFGPTVRMLRNPGRGPGAARHAGVLEARGDYIAFADADDLVEPTKHERQLAVLERSEPYTLVHTGSRVFRTDGDRPGRIRTGAEQAVGRCTRVIFETNPVCGASTMMDRSLILELGNYDPELFGTEDFGMSLTASVYCDFVYLPEPLYQIRQHAGNLTRNRTNMTYFHWLAQEKFRRRLPEAFAALPEESVRQYMRDPVLQTVKDAYWHRRGRGYGRLLRLARRIAPEDRDIATLWARRHIPMWALRLRDRWNACPAPGVRS